MAKRVKTHPTSEYDFTQVGVGKEVQAELEDRFPTLEDIVQCELEELMEIDNVGEKRALSIKEAAADVITGSSEDSTPTLEDGVPVVPAGVLLDHKPTAAERRELRSNRAVLNQGTTDKEARYVLVEIPVDKYLRIRKRVLITEATCEDCGYDVCMVNELPPFSELGASQREEVRKTLKVHKSRLHSTAATKHIVTQEELDNIKWDKPVQVRPA